ncbi:MAG TPA: glycosyltransferase N-terminal domain-containing protein, partial [Thermoanaerobaculia bacterium]|nr:glycosyltransferase N-terminal domain-containing protein [Thermoanaerobaculia bacterium]
QGPEGAGSDEPPLWIHAVSVGEVGVAATLAAALPAGTPLVVTTVTPTGQAQAKKSFGRRSPQATAVGYLPFDLGFAVERFLDHLSPRALVLVEGDYWPLLLSRVRRRGLPVAVVNGRVGDASLRRQHRLGRLFGRRLLGAVFGAVHRFGVQTPEDARRLTALGVGAERVTVTGNLKFESAEPAPLPKLEARLAGLAAGRRLLVAGSTMAGEEEKVLAALRATGTERAMLVLAPRHPERWDEVARRLDGDGWSWCRRSGLDLEADLGAGDDGERPAVVLLDSLGELAALYRVAAAAFVGGTLVDTGGHNPLEPARFGVPLAVGPSMRNFRDMAARFDAAGAWVRAADADALGRVWSGWLDDPEVARAVGERALTLVEENRGALDRTLAMLAPLLAERPMAPR